MATVRANGLRIEHTGTDAPRQPWVRVNIDLVWEHYELTNTFELTHVSKLHSLINRNFYNPEFGHLLHHRDAQNPNILHYAVQLNDLEALAWEPIHSNRQKGRGRLATWRIDWNRFQDAKWVNILEKEKINQALHISVDQFHEHWQYDLFRFNCEHWARLIATGDCRCCQIKEFKKMQKIPVVGIIAVGVAGMVTGAWEHNEYAQELIEQEVRHLNNCR